jgi:hypothetical protein
MLRNKFKQMNMKDYTTLCLETNSSKWTWKTIQLCWCHNIWDITLYTPNNIEATKIPRCNVNGQKKKGTAGYEQFHTHYG